MMAVIALMVGIPGRALGQVALPLQWVATNGFYNLFSQKGAPVVSGSPTATAGNFANLVSYGAVSAPTNSTLGSGSSMAANSVSLGLPHGMNSDGTVNWVLARARVGAPYVMDASKYLFGQVLPPPSVDERGSAISNPSSYWRSEPYTTNGHSGDRFYWCADANVVFASQSGQVWIPWVKANPESSTPTNTSGYIRQNGYYYAIVTNTFVVSSTPVKPAVNIFWNQTPFNHGPQVTIPAGKVFGMIVVTNDTFPIRVTTAYTAPGQTLMATNGLSETRTLWYDPTTSYIGAFNAEGRVFVEYYGNLNADGVTHQFLGYDLVNVIQKPRAIVSSVDLGSPLLPAIPDPQAQVLTPVPIQSLTFSQKVYTLASADSTPSLSKYWAVVPETNQNVLSLYWYKAGTLGIRWPVYLNTYIQDWSSDPTTYSQYIRPDAGSAASASTTAIHFSGNQNVSLAYFDPLDTTRAFSDSSSFYTWLTPSQPALRALLQYNAGNTVYFERVASWLDSSVSTGSAAFMGTVATNLLTMEQRVPTHGLKGDYFSNPGYDDPNNFFNGTTNFSRVDPTIDFTWTSTGPGGTLGTANYAVRWTGFIKAQYTDTYTIQVDTDDGAQVRIGSTLLINQWMDQAPTSYSNTVTMVAGQYYPVDLRYYNRGGGAEIHLRWSCSKTLMQVIPTGQLYPSTNFLYQVPLPTVITQNKMVGERIEYPDGLIPSPATGIYRSGHINPATGTAYASDAYVDPLASGFTNTTSSSILAVNASPSNNVLEVWWFTPSHPPSSDFTPTYWPSTMGYYNLSWPQSTQDKIVLASNQGSGPLTGLQQKAWIYTQNDRSQPGFNPNEEHALILGGAAYALRDDLNVMSGINYSSEPFVLLEYIDVDGRPSMRPFHVLREDPDHQWTFHYQLTVGDNGGLAPALQAPAPLPALFNAEKPLNPTTMTNVCHEVGSISVTSYTAVDNNQIFGQSAFDEQDVWISTANTPLLVPYQSYQLYSDTTSTWVFLKSVDPGPAAGNAAAVGILSSNKPMALSAIGAGNQNGHYLFGISTGVSLSVNQPVEICNTSFRTNFPGRVTSVGNTNGTQVVDIDLGFTSTPGSALPASLRSADILVPVLDYNVYARMRNGMSILRKTRHHSLNAIQWTANGIQNSNTSAAPDINQCTYQDRDGNIWFYRGPHDANDEAFVSMQFYYKTQPGFYFPVDASGATLTPASQPPVGTVTPYLRAWSQSAGKYYGDPIHGNAQSATIGDDNALPIAYSAVWSTNIPQMSVAQSLMVASAGLPAVRDQTSVGILYQQSMVVGGLTNPSVILHDPTRYKTFTFGGNGRLAQLPSSVQTVNQLGKVFFPVLPPHLADRFFFDSTVGANGALVFGGDFVNPGTGQPYLFPNVLTASDATYLNGLCAVSDLNYGQWTNAIASLSVTVTPYAWSNGHWQADTNNPLRTTYGSGDICVALSQDVPVDSYALTAAGPGSGYVTLVMQGGKSPAAQKSPLSIQVLQVTPNLFRGSLQIVTDSNPVSPYITLQHVVDLAGHAEDYQFDWWIGAPVDGQAPAMDDTSTNLPGNGWLRLSSDHFPDKVRATLGGQADYVSLGDQWLVARYRSTNTNNPTYGRWSQWTRAQLAEGYVKRALSGINPFNQRVTDLLNNSVNDQVSMLTQAGARWEGNVALNQNTLNNQGLIAIYETILNQARNLSIDSGINYGPANDALLLAAGYISDLYTILGNEAWAEANNPTVSVGTDSTFNTDATALFPFMGETATILEQQQDLLRGRDDFQTPGVQIAPVYNRLYWNFTKGINSGQQIYSLNFDIKPAPDNNTGSVGPADAKYMFPQGHGDAYGHYLTALFNYYKLIMDPDFSWVPSPEATTVLGVPVLVNYMHERKFAQSAAAMARTGQLVYDLTWRGEYLPGSSNGWANLNPVRVNTNAVINTNLTTLARYSRQNWGSDQWACRLGQGEYLNWIVGNSMLPAVDPDTTHAGITRVDRTTVSELMELPASSDALLTGMDNAEAHLNPLGLPDGTVPFDINPSLVIGATAQTHYEQMYIRATQALNNAVYAYNQVGNVTQALRGQRDSLTDFVNGVNAQEQAFTNQLIAIFGTPYSDDMGVGQTYPQDYAGPDVFHYMYVNQTDIPESADALKLSSDPFNAGGQTIFNLRYSRVPPQYLSWTSDWNAARDSIGSDFIQFTLNSEQYVEKPASWTGSRAYAGTIQQTINDYKVAWWGLYNAVAAAVKVDFAYEQAVKNFRETVDYNISKTALQSVGSGLDVTLSYLVYLKDINSIGNAKIIAAIEEASLATQAVIPTSLIAGVAFGGDQFFAPREAIVEAAGVTKATAMAKDALFGFSNAAAQNGDKIGKILNDTLIRGLDTDNTLFASYQAVRNAEPDLKTSISGIDSALRTLSAKASAVQSAITAGNQLLATRETYRAREAAIINGYRTRDASFRLFQNERLERYNTLFNLAQRYALLAAYAYDYETGSLGTRDGKNLINQIVSTRSLGVVDGGGNPQYAGSSSSGDPGLSSVLAQMSADWAVLKGRLGFNNPDGYGTTISLRTENYRILPGVSGDSAWRDTLSQNRLPNILSDSDVKAYCLQVDDGSGLPVPGFVIPFSTTITDGYNLFGKLLSPGDHSFSSSSFSTKIFSIGVALDGYKGMDTPSSISSGVSTNTSDPDVTFLDPNALAATPYVYLIPVGVDSMRSPPLGDTPIIRTWSVADVAVPVPYNLGASHFSTKPLWQTSDSLQEPLFQIRKFQAFRPVANEANFSSSIFAGSAFAQSQFTNRRLIGRSVWNSQWKLVIPGKALLNDPNGGLDRFIRSVKDIKLNFVTYSYSGN